MVYYNFFFKPNPHIQWRCWSSHRMCCVNVSKVLLVLRGLCASICGHDALLLALRAPSISSRGGTHLVTTGRFLIYSEELFKNFYSCISSCVLLHHRVIFSSRQSCSVSCLFHLRISRVIQPQTAVVSSHRRMFPLLTKMHEQI